MILDASKERTGRPPSRSSDSRRGGFNDRSKRGSGGKRSFNKNKKGFSKGDGGPHFPASRFMNSKKDFSR